MALKDNEIIKNGEIIEFDDMKVTKTEMESTVTETKEYYKGGIFLHRAVRVFLKPINIGARIYYG
jgi:hypothetical protein